MKKAHIARVSTASRRARSLRMGLKAAERLRTRG